jgi:hypothetical protein
MGDSTHVPHRWSDQVMLVDPGGGRRPRRKIELGEDVAQVPLDRPFAQAERGGNRLVRISGRNQPQHLQFARRQPMAMSGGGALINESIRARSGAAPSRSNVD